MLILVYQLVIGGVILAAAIAAGKRGLWVSTAVAVAWTLSHVVMPWLMALQAITILLAFKAGRKFVPGRGRLYVLRTEGSPEG